MVELFVQNDGYVGVCFCWGWDGRGVSMEAASHGKSRQVTVDKLPKYLGALPAGPNDRHGVFIPRLLLQLTQLSPGLMGSGGSCGRGDVNFSDNLKY